MTPSPTVHQAWAEKLSFQIGREYATTTSQQMPEASTTEDHHAAVVWGSIAQAVAYSTAVHDRDMTAADIRAATELAMNYVQITSDVPAAVTAQFGPGMPG